MIGPILSGNAKPATSLPAAASAPTASDISLEPVEAFARVFAELGGELVTGAEVAEIEVGGGWRFAADLVVSNPIADGPGPIWSAF